MNPLARFDRFLLVGDEAGEMRSEFKPVLANATLTRDESLTRLLETHKKVPGIYLWVLKERDKGIQALHRADQLVGEPPPELCQ